VQARMLMRPGRSSRLPVASLAAEAGTGCGSRDWLRKLVEKRSFCTVACLDVCVCVFFCREGGAAAPPVDCTVCRPPPRF